MRSDSPHQGNEGCDGSGGAATQHDAHLVGESHRDDPLVERHAMPRRRDEDEPAEGGIGGEDTGGIAGRLREYESLLLRAAEAGVRRGASEEARELLGAEGSEGDDEEVNSDNPAT